MDDAARELSRHLLQALTSLNDSTSSAQDVIAELLPILQHLEEQAVSNASPQAGLIEDLDTNNTEAVNLFENEVAEVAYPNIVQERGNDSLTRILFSDTDGQDSTAHTSHGNDPNEVTDDEHDPVPRILFEGPNHPEETENATGHAFHEEDPNEVTDDEECVNDPPSVDSIRFGHGAPDDPGSPTIVIPG